MIGGMVSLDEFNDYFNINIESQDCDTINGFLIDLLGSIPMSAEEKNIEYKNFIFKIKEKRIEKIKFYVQKEV
nr:transporter associated domain-containing protein [Clostridium botulinum]